MADIKLIVDTKSVDRAINRIDRLRTGVGRTSKTTRDYTQTTQRSTSAIQQHTNAVKGNTGALATQSMAAQKSSKGMKHFASVGLQQVGYQFSDFAVQVQGGTSALVAFGQQGSQLAGLLFLLPGMFGAVAGAVVSIAIPAFTALGNVFFNLQGAVERFEDAMESMQATISTLEGHFDLQEKSIVDLIDKYGLLAGAVRDASFEVARLQVIEMEQAVNDLLIPAFDDLLETFNRIDEHELAPEKFRGLADEIGLSEERASALSEALNQFYAADGIQEQAVAAARLGSILEEIPDSVLETDEGLRQAVQSLQEFIQPAARAADLTRELENGVNDATSAVGPLSGAVQVLKGLWANVRDRITEGVNATGEMANRASDVMRILSGKSGVGREDPVVLDPRDPRYDPIAAEMARIRGETSIYKPPSIGSSDGGGAAGSISQTTQAIEELNKQLSKSEQLMLDVGKTVSESFGDALMSIVDGSKSAADAFKDMARQILKQAFDMLVVKPIMNSIMGFFSPGLGMSTGMANTIVSELPAALVNANGNAFSGGKVIPYANGGVVNRPTMFPMANGAGLMGEAGPEAIMPLKRGKNGKLGVQVEGGQQPIVINQAFNFSANGDDSVKRIIQQEAPKIASYTQQQILDQRRRGGAMKQTFG